MGEIIRILVVDDHPIVRRGLKSLLKPRHGVEVVGEARDGNEAVERYAALRPDIVLMDLQMPNKTGLEAIPEILAADPRARIIVLTSFIEDEKVVSAIRTGAAGYILKDSSPQELLAAIQQVHQGNSALHPSVARALVESVHQPKTVPQKELTDRERDVLRLIARGLSNKQIAEELVLGETTIRFHISSILGKLNLENRTQAALFAAREGMV
jgi:NarL family two-component system response regulator LiaR